MLPLLHQFRPPLEGLMAVAVPMLAQTPPMEDPAAVGTFILMAAGLIALGLNIANGWRNLRAKPTAPAPLPQPISVEVVQSLERRFAPLDEHCELRARLAAHTLKTAEDLKVMDAERRQSVSKCYDHCTQLIERHSAKVETQIQAVRGELREDAVKLHDRLTTYGDTLAEMRGEIRQALKHRD